ncbi:MAG: 50S ribosomal protein L19e [Candidatus Aenigmarchaeota archaeon]|nr:50S ribosomal protein L19e [Candidatus Aenigmarchaeota archaeon]
MATGLRLQRRLAASILKVGETKIWLDPSRYEDIKNAITRKDIKKLIEKGYIKKRKDKIPFPEKKVRKKQGPGSRKGKLGARKDKKRAWINTIRALRKMLKELKNDGKIDKETFKLAYRLAKAGTFRSRAHLKLYLKQKGVNI